MSDHSKQETGSDSPGKSAGGSIVPWIAVGVLSASLGSAVPFVLSGQQPHGAGNSGEPDGQQSTTESHGNGGAAKSAPKNPKTFTMPTQEETIILPFGEPGKDQAVVVNLDEGRMSRYLRISISLQISKSKEDHLKKQIEAKKIILRNWLLSKISDLDLDDIRGGAGQNRLRREIREQFNAVLCPDGYDEIHDVLFEEFNVQ